MLRENTQSLFQREPVWAAINQRENIDAESAVHLRAFVKRGQDLIRVGVLVKIDHDPHSLAVGFIAKVRNTLQTALTNNACDPLDQSGFIDHICNSETMMRIRPRDISSSRVRARNLTVPCPEP